MNQSKTDPHNMRVFSFLRRNRPLFSLKNGVNFRPRVPGYLLLMSLQIIEKTKNYWFEERNLPKGKGVNGEKGTKCANRREDEKFFLQLQLIRLEDSQK